MHISNVQVKLRSRGKICITTQNFVKIGQTVVEMWPFFKFLRWRSSTILNWWGSFWGHPLRVRGGLCHLLKFGLNPFSSFLSSENLNILHLWLGNAYSRPQSGFWATSHSRWEAVSTQPPKGTFFCENTSYDVHIVEIGPLVRPVHLTKKPKKKDEKHEQW